MLCSRALTGITDNHTVTVYKRDCKNFAVYCRLNAVKTPEQLEKRKTEILQKYEDSLENAGYKVGLIGTIEAIIGDKVIPASNTTPESYMVQKYFHDMVEAGCDAVVMEVSSQGLMLHRTQGFWNFHKY